MPYTTQEIKKRPSYQNIIDADKNELKKFFEDEEIKAQQSGSTMEAVQTLRDEEGFILSYEDPDNLGNTMKSSIQKVRLPMEYSQSDIEQVQVKLKEERTFSAFRPKLKWPPKPPADDGDAPFTEEETKENLTTQEKVIDDSKGSDDTTKKIADATGQTTEQVKESTSNKKSPGKTLQ